MTRMLRLAVTIRERADNWEVLFPGLPSHDARSACDALACAQSIAQALPEPSIMTITWEPQTPIGRQVVQVITQ